MYMKKWSIFLSIYCLGSIILFSIVWGVQILVLLGGWYALCGTVVYILHKNNEQYSSVIKIMIIYPLLVIFTKYLMANDILQYDYLNRFEHFLFSFVLSFIIWKGTNGEKLYIKILLVIGLVNLVGIGNEFLEYIIREIKGFDEKYAMWVYQDTVIDLMVNLIASISFLYVTLIIKIVLVKRK